MYDSFINDYDTVNTQKEQHQITVYNAARTSEEISRWERDIGGATVKIMLEQPTLSDPQEYLLQIAFATDWDTFIKN